ncbi:MAG: phosphoribosylamine--glycine ligase [Ignavibacteriales bacterium]|nr:MAG: phosphoribosylamine--glycine ligase [Ignavibacteriales bacterium]
MNVLVIGSGGREHALAYGISKSSEPGKLFISPGNPGTALLAENVQLTNNKEIVNFCKSGNIELVVIGPEKPLVEGLSDLLRDNNINVFGPSKAAADIEAYKSFAKNLMQKYNIPTAGYMEFSNAKDALEYIKGKSFPVVIKADGLAAGKGVIICNDLNEAEEALKNIFDNKIFGKAGDKVIVEDFLKGEEASVLAVTDGSEFVCLPAAQDHKRISDGDKGKNTGGMGAYAPAPLVTSEVLEKVEDRIIKPVLEAMKTEGRIFTGCLYCGLMIQDGEPSVVEFNCRFGDPETQAVIPLLEGNFLELLYSSARGKINKNSVKYSGNSAVCVVAASHGYPDFYDTGFEISGLDEIKNNDIIVFHAGTRIEHNKLVTSGGRVLGLTASSREGDLKEAKLKAYDNLRKIHYEHIYYRTDISDKAFKSPKSKVQSQEISSKSIVQSSKSKN